MPNRRDVLKLSGAAALGLLATGNGEASAEASGAKINVAGYPYDRVQAIKDGLVGIDRDYVLIPVFISRTFRHRNIYVHADSGIEKPEDLRGKRVGTPGYGMSATTWIRGMLLDQYGVQEYYRETDVLKTSLPWAMDEYEKTTKLMGKDYWRYGIEANRKELEAVMRYTYEQGLVKERGRFEDMFHPSAMELLG